LFSVVIFVLDRWFTLLPLRFIVVFIPEIFAAHMFGLFKVVDVSEFENCPKYSSLKAYCLKFGL
jgi:hypothetical protein